MRPFALRHSRPASVTPWSPDDSLHPAVPRVDEHPFSLDGNAVSVGDMTDGERLGAIHAIDPRLRVQLSKASASYISQGEGAGVGGTSRLVRRGPEDVVENERAYSTVNMAGRPLVRGAEIEVCPDRPVLAMMDDQWGCDGISNTDHDIAPGHALAVVGVSHAE